MGGVGGWNGCEGEVRGREGGVGREEVGWVDLGGWW